MNTKVLWNQMKVVVVDNFTILNPTSSKSLQNWCFTFLSGKFLVKFQIQFVCLKDGVHLYSFPFQSKHVHFSDTKLGNVTFVDSLKTDTFWNLETSHQIIHKQVVSKFFFLLLVVWFCPKATSHCSAWRVGTLKPRLPSLRTMWRTIFDITKTRWEPIQQLS